MAVLLRKAWIDEGAWFAALAAISLALLIVTLLSYVVRGHETLESVLFWFGLSDANNAGDWWSGMLPILAAAMAFDGYFDLYKPTGERQGWRALGFLLLLMSLSEVTSLHRYLETRNDGSLIALGAIAVGLAGYAMLQFHRTALPSRSFLLLLLGFGLLALGPAVEQLHLRDPLRYGIRILLEEGLEIASMLVFILAARHNSAYLQRAGKNIFAVCARPWRHPVLIGVAVWVGAAAAAYWAPPGGTLADWLGATVFFACALLAVRAALSTGKMDTRGALLIGLYLAASAAALAARVDWLPTVLSSPVNARGIVFGALFMAAAVVLPMHGRRVGAARLGALGAIVASSAAVWPESRWLWHCAPLAIALSLYAVERQAVQRARTTAAVVRTPKLAK